MSSSEWKEVRLGDVCCYVNERIPIDELTLDNYVSTENMLPEKVGVVRASSLPLTGNAVKYKAGQTLISNIRPYFKKIWFANQSGGCSNDVLVLDTDDAVDKRYLYYLLSQDCFFNYVIAGSKGTKMPRGDKQQIMLFQFLLPTLPEQKTIADTLSCLDDKIELNNRINKNLEEMAQAIFKSWFVDFEPFQDGEFEDSELGRIPKGWRVGRLKSICKNITKGTTPTTLKRKFVDSGIKFIKAESITNNHSFDFQRFAYIDKETNELLKRSKLHENDILLTIAGTIGRYAIVTKNVLPANTNQAVAIIRVDENAINPLYILNLFMCNCHKEFLQSKVVQAVQANLSLGVIGDLPLVLPDNEILNRYYEIAIPIFKKKKEIEEQNQNLATIRDTLLPKLISGEIRVPFEEAQ